MKISKRCNSVPFEKTLIVCSVYVHKGVHFVYPVKTGVETSRWIFPRIVHRSCRVEFVTVPRIHGGDSLKSRRREWQRLALHFTQAECNLPAFIRAIHRIVFHAILGRAGGLSTEWKVKKILRPDIVLSWPLDSPPRKTSCHRNKFDCRSRASRALKIIVVAGEQAHGRSSTGEIRARIRRSALFEMGKACFSRRSREEGRKASSVNFPRVSDDFVRTRRETIGPMAKRLVP